MVFSRSISSLFILFSVSALAAPLDSGDVRLVLENGAGPGKALILDMTMEGGKWSKKLWGRAPHHNFAHYEGAASTDRADTKGGRLTVLLAVPTDLVAVGGKADYALEITRTGDSFAGTYTGKFIEIAVKGAMKGTIGPPGIRRIPGIVRPKPGEHPRLIFRKHELPEMRRRLTTPIGKAIESMLLVRSPLRLASQVTDRRASWMAANWAALYQLTGEKENAAEARVVVMEEAINKSMPLDRSDSHHAMRLLGIALAYDMGYDAWDDEFRRYLGEFIMITARDLALGQYEGMPMMPGTVDPTPWRHRNAIRMACVGVAALAVLDDPDADGQPMSRAAALADLAERHVAAYLREGITGAGRALEGSMYKNIALANGILQFLHAERAVLGRDLSGLNPFLLAGQVVGAKEVGPERYRFGLSSISVQASGRWPMGLGSLPDHFLPAMKWCFDRSCGPEGLQHFDCTYPYQAAYAVKNYPFTTAAKAPGGENGLPLMILDSVHGNCVFRNRWQDENDIVTTVDFGCLVPAGLGRAASAQLGSISISGLGTNWVSGRIGLPPLNRAHGGELLYAESGKPGQAFAGARLDRMYERAGRRGWRRRPAIVPGRWRTGELNVFPKPEKPATQDTGIKCTRHFAVDYSGVSGVPALFVIVDEMQNVGRQRWLYPAGKVRGSPAVLGDPAGKNLTWHFASGTPRGNYVTPVPLASGGPVSRCFVIGTLSNGPAPSVGTTTEGRTSRATVGGQTVTFDGKRITLAK